MLKSVLIVCFFRPRLLLLLPHYISALHGLLRGLRRARQAHDQRAREAQRRRLLRVRRWERERSCCSGVHEVGWSCGGCGSPGQRVRDWIDRRSYGKVFEREGEGSFGINCNAALCIFYKSWCSWICLPCVFRCRSRSNSASNGDAKENGSKNGKSSAVATKPVSKEAMKQKENKKKGLKRL